VFLILVLFWESDQIRGGVCLPTSEPLYAPFAVFAATFFVRTSADQRTQQRLGRWDVPLRFFSTPASISLAVTSRSVSTALPRWRQFTTVVVTGQ
jgi:hypothetical protein